MNQQEIDRARGHFLVIENELGSMLFDVRSAIQLMPFLEWYQVALINSFVFDGLCRVRQHILNLETYQDEGDENNG